MGQVARLCHRQLGARSGGSYNRHVSVMGRSLFPCSTQTVTELRLLLRMSHPQARESVRVKPSEQILG
jgi:hypothetical protein